MAIFPETAASSEPFILRFVDDSTNQRSQTDSLLSYDPIEECSKQSFGKWNPKSLSLEFRDLGTIKTAADSDPTRDEPTDR